MSHTTDPFADGFDKMPGFSTARDDSIHRMLVETVDETATKSVRTPRTRRGVVVFASVAVVALLAAGGAGYALTRPTPSSPGGGTAVGGATSQPTASSAPAPTGSDAPATTQTPGHVDPAGTTSPTPTPTVPLSPLGVDLSDPSTWQITYAGIGPLRLGDDYEVARTYMTHVFSLTTDAPNGPVCNWDFFRAKALGVAIEAFHAYEGSVLQYVSIDEGSALRTPSGIGLTSTLDELKATYDGAEGRPLLQGGNGEADPAAGEGRWYVTNGTGSYINFYFFQGKMFSITVADKVFNPTEFCL